MRMAFLTVIPSESLTKSLLSSPVTLSSVAKRGMFLPGDTLWFFILEVGTATLPLWSFHASESTDKK